MTKDEIIQAACDAFGGIIKQEERDNFVRFAKLVASREREECALICENYADVDTYQDGIIQDYHSHLIRLRGKE